MQTYPVRGCRAGSIPGDPVRGLRAGQPNARTDGSRTGQGKDGVSAGNHNRHGAGNRSERMKRPELNNPGWSGLSTRAANVLCNAQEILGIGLLSKVEVRDAIINRKLVLHGGGSQYIQNLGLKTWAEICLWCGAEQFIIFKPARDPYEITHKDFRAITIWRNEAGCVWRRFSESRRKQWSPEAAFILGYICGRIRCTKCKHVTI